MTVTVYDYSSAAILIYYANYAHNAPNPLIQQNTITKSAIGISLFGNSFPIIKQNNIHDNSYNLHLTSSAQVDAANNWWGTTNSLEIDEKIFDYTDDFNLGKVNYTPFLTTANPQAMPDPNAPIPTPNTSPTPTSTPTSNISTSPTQNPTATPDQSGSRTTVFFNLDWVQIATLSLLSLITALLIIVIVLLRKRSVK